MAQFRLGKPGGGAYLGSGDTFGGTDQKELTFTGRSLSRGSIIITRPTRHLAFTGRSVSRGSITLRSIYTYITPTEVKSPMHATVREATPSTPDDGSQIARVNDTVGSQVYTLLDLDIPAEIGGEARVLHADVVLVKAAAWTSGNKTLTAHLLTEQWDAEGVTYATIPALGDFVSDSGILGGGLEGDVVELDVTDLIKAAVADRDAGNDAYFGLRLSTTSTDDLAFYSSSIDDLDLTPMLRIEYSLPPLAPQDPLPSGGRVVSKRKPAFDLGRFRDPDGNDTVSAVHVQVADNDDFDVTIYDSGEVSSTSTIFDAANLPTGAPAFADLALSTTLWWRGRLRDNHGVWSEWMSPAEFMVLLKGTLVLDEPDATEASPTPQMAITFTPAGAETVEMTEWAVEVLSDGLWRPHFTHRRNGSDLTPVSVSDGKALDPGGSYRATVLLWDSVDREDMASDRAFLEVSREFTVDEVSV